MLTRLPPELFLLVADVVGDPHYGDSRWECDGDGSCGRDSVALLTPLALTCKRFAALLRSRLRSHVVLRHQSYASRLADAVATDGARSWGQDVRGLMIIGDKPPMCGNCESRHEMDGRTSSPSVDERTVTSLLCACPNLEHLLFDEPAFTTMSNESLRAITAAQSLRQVQFFGVKTGEHMWDEMFSFESFARLAALMPQLRTVGLSGLKSSKETTQGFSRPSFSLRDVNLGDLTGLHSSALAWLLSGPPATAIKCAIDSSPWSVVRRKSHFAGDVCGLVHCLPAVAATATDLELSGLPTDALDILCNCTEAIAPDWKRVQRIEFNHCGLMPRHFENLDAQPEVISIRKGPGLHRDIDALVQGIVINHASLAELVHVEVHSCTEPGEIPFMATLEDPFDYAATDLNRASPDADSRSVCFLAAGAFLKAHGLAFSIHLSDGEHVAILSNDGFKLINGPVLSEPNNPDASDASSSEEDPQPLY